MSTIRKTITLMERFSAFKSAITEGIDSGVSDKSIPDIMRAVEERMLEDGRL